MNCSEVEAITPLYLSGELDAVRADAFAAHLERCPGCAHEIEQQSEVDARLRACVPVEAGDNSAVERRIRNAITPRRRGWLWASGAIAAAVALAAVLLYRHPTPRLYADAAQDHRDEIVSRQPRKWLTSTVAINALTQSQEVPPDALAALRRVGLRLERAKLCRLDGRRYVHLVYTNGTQEFSVFLIQQAGKQGRVEAAKSNGEYVACLETGTFTAVFVADDSERSALDLARSTGAAL